MTETLTVRQVAEHAKKQHAEMTKQPGFMRPVLNARKIERIVKAYHQPAQVSTEGNGFYHYYEIGHLFVREHLVAKLARRANLSQENQDRLRRLLGETYGITDSYPEQCAQKARAAEELAQQPQHEQIYAALAREIQTLQKTERKANLEGTQNSDMISNSVCTLTPFNRKKSFAKIAEYWHEAA